MTPQLPILHWVQEHTKLRFNLNNADVNFSSEDIGLDDITSLYNLKVIAKHGSEFTMDSVDDGDMLARVVAKENSDIQILAGEGNHLIKMKARSDSSISFTQENGQVGDLTTLKISAKDSIVNIDTTGANDVDLKAYLKSSDMTALLDDGDDTVLIKAKNSDLYLMTGGGDDNILIKGSAQAVIDGGDGTDSLTVKGRLDVRESQNGSLTGIEEITLATNQSQLILDSTSLQYMSTSEVVNIHGKGSVILEGTGWISSIGAGGEQVFTQNGVDLVIDAALSVIEGPGPLANAFNEAPDIVLSNLCE